jgi:hypothetical protein
MQRADLENALRYAPVLTVLPDSKAEESMADLLKHPALPLLWGLMLGAKQAQYVGLANMPMGNMAEVARAAVIQGTIKGIDMFYDTLLELSVPSSEQEQEA